MFREAPRPVRFEDSAVAVGPSVHGEFLESLKARLSRACSAGATQAWNSYLAGDRNGCALDLGALASIAAMPASAQAVRIVHRTSPGVMHDLNLAVDA